MAQRKVEVDERTWRDYIDMLSSVADGCRELENRIGNGSYIKFQDGLWWLFQEDGEGVTGDVSIERLILKLGGYYGEKA